MCEGVCVRGNVCRGMCEGVCVRVDVRGMCGGCVVDV